MSQQQQLPPAPQQQYYPPVPQHQPQPQPQPQQQYFSQQQQQQQPPQQQMLQYEYQQQQQQAPQQMLQYDYSQQQQPVVAVPQQQQVPSTLDQPPQEVQFHQEQQEQQFEFAQVPYNAIMDEERNNRLEERTIEVRIPVEISGTLSGFEANPRCAMWQPTTNDTWKTKQYWSPTAEGISQELRGDPRHVIIHSIDLEESYNEFPVKLGITFPDQASCEGKYRTSNGAKYCAFLLPNAHNTKKRNIVEESSYAKCDYLEMYPGFTADNVGMRGVLSVEGKQHLVKASHPIIELLQKSDSDFANQLHTTQAVKINNDFYIPIETKKFNDAVETLQRDLKTNLPLANLTKFKVKIERPGEQWDSKIRGPFTDEEMDSVYETTYSSHMIFVIRYRFMGEDNTTTTTTTNSNH